MKIAHINLAKGFRGGERQTITLIQTLSEKYPEVEQILVCRKDSPMRKMLASCINLKFVNAKKQWQGHFLLSSVELVHAHEAKAVHWAWLHHLIFKTPYIITRRVDFPFKKNFLSRKTYGKADTVIAISQAIFEKLIPFSKNIKLIPDSYSNLPSNLSTIEKLKRDFSKKFVVGNIAALVKEKGQELLLEVAREFKHKYPNIIFIFLGKGKDGEFFKELSKDLDNVYWLDFQEDIGSYLKIMDIFAFPTLTEGLGSSLLDAMAYNVPIIATRTGGIPDIIKHNVNGLLFESGNSKDLSNKIELIYHDDKLKNSIINHAKENLTKFSPHEIAEKYYRIYQDIICK